MNIKVDFLYLLEKEIDTSRIEDEKQESLDDLPGINTIQYFTQFYQFIQRLSYP